MLKRGIDRTIQWTFAWQKGNLPDFVEPKLSGSEHFTKRALYQSIHCARIWRWTHTVFKKARNFLLSFVAGKSVLCCFEILRIENTFSVNKTIIGTVLRFTKTREKDFDSVRYVLLNLWNLSTRGCELVAYRSDGDASSDKWGDERRDVISAALLFLE